MLTAQELQINGRRADLLPPTSLKVGRGQLLLVSGDGQEQRTALALALSGRMKPGSGKLDWDGAAKTRKIRSASALLDSPGVNEPEQHLSVSDLVTEDLALIPRRYRGALLSKPWLKVHSFEDIAGLWIEQLPAERRLELLTALALADPAVDLLVLDSPDRHSSDPTDWLPRLEQLAHDAGRPLAVVAVVSSLPEDWDGPSAAIGNAVKEAVKEEPPAEDAAEAAEPPTEETDTEEPVVVESAPEDPDESPDTDTLQRTAK